jgi:ESF2/ABP1 family protein
MSATKRSTYLDRGLSDESDNDAGYDSEAAEISKASRATKRRKIDHYHTDDEANESEQQRSSTPPIPRREEPEEVRDKTSQPESDGHASSTQTVSHKKSKRKNEDKKETAPGVIYLSSLPPYLKPSALRNLLEQRGFGPIHRLFLAPASKHKSASKKNSRQLYTEGWIEFTSKKTARRCAESLNTQQVGGKKGGFYHDDVWNMKYLRGMRWEELMAGVREEKREEEGKRDEERRIIARETKMFIEGVEEGRRKEGMKRKREKKKDRQDDVGDAAGSEVKRTWRQNEVKGQHERDKAREERISDDVKQVLGKIF